MSAAAEAGPRAVGSRAELTPEQRAAIDARTGSLFLSAAAGSGKTTVLVERFVRAVLDDEVAVDRILAITFTDKAAAELRARIRERLLEVGARERARDAEGGWVTTFHGFCARLLRSHALAAGLDPEFAVLDEDEADRVGSEAFDQALEAFLAGGTSAQRVELVAAYAPDRLETTVRTVHGRLRSGGDRWPALPDAPEPPLAP
ncbi:MAG: UvrD-helicase domain-containing protein, partial [Actinomycetota bacterium]|nr:UvrD-helicase domain-containing protein [Actinomycetota bacterium]